MTKTKSLMAAIKDMDFSTGFSGFELKNSAGSMWSTHLPKDPEWKISRAWKAEPGPPTKPADVTPHVVKPGALKAGEVKLTAGAKDVGATRIPPLKEIVGKWADIAIIDEIFEDAGMPTSCHGSAIASTCDELSASVSSVSAEALKEVARKVIEDYPRATAHVHAFDPLESTISVTRQGEGGSIHSAFDWNSIRSQDDEHRRVRLEETAKRLKAEQDRVRHEAEYYNQMPEANLF